MGLIKKIFLSKQFDSFVWLLIEAFIGAGITYFSGLDWVYAPPLIAILQVLGKELNKYRKRKISFNLE